MQCTDCKLPLHLYGSSRWTGSNPCPYKTGMDLSKSFLDTAISGYMQVAYPEWNSEEIEKELRRFFNDLVKSLAEDSVSFNMKDIMIKAEAQKFMGWANEKHKGETPTITLTTTS